MSSSKKISYGDIVMYKLKEEETFCLCRVFALLSKLTVSMDMGLDPDENEVYVLSVLDEDIGQMPIEMFVDDLFELRFDDIEWGNIPKKNIVLADRSIIEHYVDASMSTKFKKRGTCPHCGDVGYVMNFRLVCSWHGPF